MPHIASSSSTCARQVWWDQHTLLVGTDQASVLLLEEGELRQEIHVQHPDLV